MLHLTGHRGRWGYARGDWLGPKMVALSGLNHRGDEVEPMQAHQARPGIVVRVHKSYKKPEFEGMQGMIKHCYGDAAYPAVDVQLEDGRLELFWFHQLERVEEREGRAAV